MNFSKVVIGKYINKNSFYHRISPLLKLILFIFGFILVFWSHPTFENYTYITLYAFAIILIAKIPLYMIIKQWKFILFLFIFIFLIMALFTANKNHNTMHIGNWHFADQALPNAIFVVWRAFLMINFANIFTSTTKSNEITMSIEQILMVFKIFKLPVQEISIMISVALRFIPTILLEADIIMKAQLSRGVEFNSKNIFVRLKSLTALIIPLFLSSFSKAEDLALAMDARGYVTGAKRSQAVRLKFDFIGFIFLITMALLIEVVMLHVYVYGDKSSPNGWFKNGWNWWNWYQPKLS